jgi:lysophospholipase L1-like esterase
MDNSSRRKFIKNAAMTSVAAFCLPSLDSLALTKSASPKSGNELKKEAIILFQGDSITDGNRGRDNDLNHIMGHGYAFSIASRIGADYPEKNYHFYNRGISGNKVIDLEKRWQTDTIDLKPDVLSILVGVNDSTSVITNWEPVVSIQKYEEIYDRLLNQTRTIFPDILFVLGEPFILKGTRVNDHWQPFCDDIKQRQEVVRKLADKYNAVFVDYQQLFNKACDRAPYDYWIWDGVHPTVAGHELMTREWLKQVETRIKF